MKLELPIKLEFIKTDYGHFLMNPIGDNYFIISPIMLKEMEKVVEDLALYGESFMEIIK